jgi:hypothetical protein
MRWTIARWLNRVLLVPLGFVVSFEPKMTWSGVAGGWVPIHEGWKLRIARLRP